MSVLIEMPINALVRSRRHWAKAPSPGFAGDGILEGRLALPGKGNAQSEESEELRPTSAVPDAGTALLAPSPRAAAWSPIIPGAHTAAGCSADGSIVSCAAQQEHVA
jgi:hypothetical protein